jgi:hypothetical protein
MKKTWFICGFIIFKLAGVVPAQNVGDADWTENEAVAGDAVANGAGELAADVAGQAPDFTSV